MRILIHSDEYYPTCAACTYRMGAFVRAFVEAGDQVTVITSSANLEAGGRQGWPSAGERTIYAPTIRMKKKTTLMRMLNNLSFAFTSVLAAGKAGKADVVITTSPPPLVSLSGWLIAKIKRAKLVYDVRDIWPDVALEMNSFSEDSLYCKVFRRITDFMYRHAHMVTTVSPGKVKKLKQHITPNSQKVELVANGFDREIAKGVLDQELVKQYQLEDKFTCVYVGNIGLAQGLEMVLDIAENTRHEYVQFLLFGKGAEKERLEQEAAERGLENVRFAGVLPHEKVFTVMRKAKLSIIPLKSANMSDSVPTKVYEALGLGCPVFLIAEGDACKIVDETGLGMAVSPGEQEKLVRAFDEFLDRYDGYCGHRPGAERLMYEKYARQTIACAFREKLHELVNTKAV